MIRRALPAAALVAVAVGCGTTTGSTPAASTPSGPARLTTERCADVVVLGLRGQGQSLRSHRGAGAEVDAVVRAFVRSAPAGTTVRLQPVLYPNGPDATYDADVARGVRMVGWAAVGLTGCPRTGVVLAGYSQGAQVAHLAAARRAYGGVVLIGDPLRDPDDRLATYSFGTVLTGRGNAGAGPELAARQRPSVVEICVAGDNVCDAPPGGRVGAVSRTHHDFYEGPAHAAAAGRAVAGMLFHR